MALFEKKEETPPYEVVKPKLLARDGHLHVLMLNTWSIWKDTKFTCDDKYMEQVEHVIVGMQDDGFEITDIQHNSMSNGTGFGAVSYTTMITYK